MKKVSSLVIVAALVALAFAAGSWVTWKASGRGQAAAGRKVLYWIDPMHPAYKSDKPGIAPDCGMQLEPVYADDPGGATAQPVPGALRVSDEKRQLIGVRTGIVEARPIARTIRTVGRVVVDESRLYRLLAPSEGVARRIFDYSTGSLVRKNDLLMSFLPRDTEYLRAQPPYFYALDVLSGATKSALPQDQAQQGLKTAVDALVKLGMSQTQIEEIGRTRKLAQDIEVRSPVGGYVMARSVSPEQQIDRGFELFRVADVGHVWILADVFEHDATDVRAGTRVQVALPYRRTRTFEARVSNAIPQFDAESRTIKMRLEADNPDYALRPGMFVDVEIPVSAPAAVTVPLDALVDSGMRKTVFVDRGSGYVEARPVETGMRFDDRIEIVKGLAAGERIVVSGTFLLDSESRMKTAAMGITTPARDPVCGMDVDQARARAAGRTATHDGQTFYFCSDDCRKKFAAGPAGYLK